MARKPLDQLSPAYRKRIISAERKGKSRQQARGHKPKEHIIRAERARAAHKLTEPERAVVRRWLHDFETVYAIGARGGGEVDFSEVMPGEDASDAMANILDSPLAVQQQYYRAALATQQMRSAFKRRGFAGIGAEGIAQMAMIFGLSERAFWYH